MPLVPAVRTPPAGAALRAGGAMRAGGGRTAGRGVGALRAAAATLPSVSLEEVVGAADLQTRVDRKYLLTPGLFADFVAAVRSDLRVLEVDGVREFRYSSVYFDTPDLALYHAHRQGRRRRFKVRTRNYLDSGFATFEVKVKGGRGETVKRRMPYGADELYSLNREARDFLAGVLDAQGATPSPELRPVLTVDYVRTTLLAAAAGTRLTCDVEMSYVGPNRSASGPDLVLVETKSAGGRSELDRRLWAMGARPVKMSKYCVGTALVNGDLAANRWNRPLRREFGWRPHRPG